MPRRGFKRNAKAIGDILKNDEGGKAAVMAAAKRVLAEIQSGANNASAEGSITEYETDRYVAGVTVRADDQARDGVATKAANRVAQS